MKQENYNGWSNYETWHANLLLTETIEVMKEQCSSWLELSEKIKNLIKEINEDALTNFTPESVKLIINIGSIHRLDFDEIAKSHFENY